MKRQGVGSIATDAFFDNFTFAALFGKLHIPGSPSQIVDPRSLKDFSNDELLQSLQDFQVEMERIRVLVLAGSLSGSLITNEALQSLLRSWSKSSLEPLETLRQSR
jgi:hypothetical protein